MRSSREGDHLHHSHQHRQLHQQPQPEQQQQHHSGPSPSSAVSSWGVTYLVQSAKRGWQRHKSPHLVSLDETNNWLDVSDAVTSRLQERVDLTAACAFEDLHVAFVAAAGGQNIIRFTLDGQPVRKFALIADRGKGATELCQALDRQGVMVQGMEDLPDAVFLTGRDPRTAQALDTAIPSLSRPEVQAYVVRLLFQDSFRQFVGDLSEMFSHVQTHIPVPFPPPTPAPTTPLASSAREDGGGSTGFCGRNPDKTGSFDECGGGGSGSGVSGRGDGNGTRVHDGDGDDGDDGTGGDGGENSAATEGAESSSIPIGNSRHESGKESAAIGGSGGISTGGRSGRGGAGGKGKRRALQKAGSRGVRDGKNSGTGKQARKEDKGGGVGGTRAEPRPRGGSRSGTSSSGESGTATTDGTAHTSQGLRSVPQAAPKHHKRFTAATAAGTRSNIDAAASDLIRRGASRPAKRARTHDRQSCRNETAGGSTRSTGSSLPARKGGADSVVAVGAAATAGSRRQGASSSPLPVPVRPATSSGRAPGLCVTLMKIWSKVNKHPASWAFSKPVDLAKAPGYLDVVKHPIDLESIRSRLDGPTVHYTTREMLRDDLVLMCRNAMLYNEEGDDYHRAAVELLPFIESVFAQ